jgi:hypothetical protein
MTPEAAKAMYKRLIGVGETIYIRRYTGTGTSRPHTDYAARARVTGYAANELVGTAQQGDRRAILLADDLTAAGITLPITANDKAVVRGKELAIIAPDDSTRRLEGELIAYDLRLRG